MAINEPSAIGLLPAPGHVRVANERDHDERSWQWGKTLSSSTPPNGVERPVRIDQRPFRAREFGTPRQRMIPPVCDATPMGYPQRRATTLLSYPQIWD